MKKLGVICGFLAFLAMGACKDCEPVQQPGNGVIVTFYRLDSLLMEQKKIELDTSFTKVAGLDNDSTLYDASDDAMSSYTLPVSGSSTSSTFVFEHKNGDFDTIGLSYTVNVIPVGPDCGFYEEVTNIQVIKKTFDSVEVVKDFISLGDALHIEIYEQ